MKTIFTICGLILIAGSFFIWKSMQMPSVYGDFSNAAPAPVAVADVVDRPEEFMGKLIQVEGTIYEQCKTMGCYFSFHSGEKSLRVELKEVAMNAPMREGHQAKVEGQIVPYSDGYQLFANAVEFK